MTAALDPLADLARWVVWRNEPRGKDGKLTKVPYNPTTRRRAKADDPSTWGTRKQAQAAAGVLVNGAGGGIGIEFGDIGNDLFLAGIDLDSCLIGGGLADWAAAILEIVQSYAEISPSGCGLKIFFYMAAEDVRPFLKRIDVEPTNWGMRRSMGGNGADHGPAVEFYAALRYFAVTDSLWPGQPDRLTLLDADQLTWLARLIPPPRKAAGGSKGGTKPEGDDSRSAAAYRLGLKLRRVGASYEAMVAALEADRSTTDWVREKGHSSNDRELKRIWEKAGKQINAPTEDDLALDFTERHGDELAYVALWSRWLKWDGALWRFEDTLEAFDLARRLIRATPMAKKDARTVAAIERLARADRRHARSADIWNADPMLLATPEVAVDLRTGITRAPLRDDYCTKATAVIPGGSCPQWLAFLDRITSGDTDLQAYLRRVAGYCLTGASTEHVLFFCYGTGANGKSVFVNTLVGILGDYAAIAPMEVFCETIGDRHPTELAHLHGARLVVAHETEAGRRWAESRIKALTGGDKIVARFMRADFFEFQPQFKLAIVGNHKPRLSSIDEAIRRRLHLVPFSITIPAAERDPGLADKLRTEWAGILAWAIEGCLEWQRIGLAPPPAVIGATATYLDEEDAIAQWIADCCVTGRRHWCSGDRLWRSWKAWSELSNEKTGSRKAFSQALLAHGFRAEKSQEIRGFGGVDLRQEEGRHRADLD